MKTLIFLTLVSIYINWAHADSNSFGHDMTSTASHRSDHPRKIATIHQRIIAVPSSRGGHSTASESNHVPTIDRKIETLQRFRRVRKSVTAYPKHHLLQPVELPLDEVQPKEGLNSTTAPYTDKHHSWKKIPVILGKLL